MSMEDEEEIESHPTSPASSDHQTGPSQPVTVAAPPPPSRQSLTLALPIQQPRTANTTTGGGASHGREDCWSEGATSTLIDAWGERYIELNRGNLKQKHWQEVADVVTSREDYTKVPKTDIQCKNRIDTLKKKYKIELAKIASGISTKWSFFDRIDQLIGPSSRKNEDLDNHTPSGPTPKSSAAAAFRNFRSLRQPQVKQRESTNSGDSTDGLPPATNNVNGKRWRFKKEPIRSGWGGKSESSSMKELSRAILKFGEVYEKVEKSKLEQVMEMEKQRMELTRELELQRLRFFMKTQIELSQLKHRRRVVVGNGRRNSNNSG
ncbi:PREDICTED: trihelix transcription factor ASIL2-like [Nelumbo nucifera]|uniref:Trihelix transcription factor ASIL2-like n=1 Tax=Nelumbo nucifera TaxID=4432 RepID=A0A1U8ABR8_NELNU|nr:PREDICTED: trihelix transcription factor ASIL2-like [Nelumbo nucifera]